MERSSFQPKTMSRLRRDVMVLPLSETIDCIHGKLTEKKILQPRRSNRLSRSCCSSFNLSSCSTSSEFSCNSKTSCLLLTNEVNCNLLRESKHQEGRARKSVNSICVTVSAITHLSDDDSLKDRCLSCSLDGLKVRHPRCDTRVNGVMKTRPSCDTITETSLHFERSQRTSNLNVDTTFSSMTLHSTWPSRWQNSGGEKFLRASTGADIDLTTISSSDSLEIVSCDPHSGEDEEQERTNIAAGNIAVDIIQKDKNCFLVPIDQLIQGDDILKPSGEDVLKIAPRTNITLENDPYGDDICEDWDDGHESDESDSRTYTCEGTVRQDKESHDDSVVYVSEVDIDVYTVSSKSTEIHQNEVMSLCDWSFLVESKRKKKKDKKLLKKIKSALISEKKLNDEVSSCSQSQDELEEGEEDDDDSEEEEEEDNDHGSVNKYFMNQMKKKKEVHGKKNIKKNLELLNYEENQGPVTFYNRDISDTGCISSASTVARIQQF